MSGGARSDIRPSAKPSASVEIGLRKSGSHAGSDALRSSSPSVSSPSLSSKALALLGEEPNRLRVSSPKVVSILGDEAASSTRSTRGSGSDKSAPSSPTESQRHHRKMSLSDLDESAGKATAWIKAGTDKMQRGIKTLLKREGSVASFESDTNNNNNNNNSSTAGVSAGLSSSAGGGINSSSSGASVAATSSTPSTPFSLRRVFSKVGIPEPDTSSDSLATSPERQGISKDETAARSTHSWESKFAQRHYDEFASALKLFVRRSVAHGFAELERSRRGRFAEMPIKTDLLKIVYQACAAAFDVPSEKIDAQLAQLTVGDNAAARRLLFQLKMREVAETVVVDVQGVLDDEGSHDLFEAKKRLCAEAAQLASVSGLEQPNGFVPRQVVALCVAMIKQGVWFSRTVFRCVCDETRRLNARHILRIDEDAAVGGAVNSLEDLDCDTLGYVFTEWVTRRALLPLSKFALVFGDWTKAEAVLNALPHRELLVFIVAFLRTFFAHSAANGLGIKELAERFAGCFLGSSDAKSVEFVSMMLEKWNLVPHGSSAVGWMVTIADNSQPQTEFIVSDWDDVKQDYGLRVTGSSRIAMRASPSQILIWRGWGELPLLPHFEAIIMSEIVPAVGSTDSTTATRLSCLSLLTPIIEARGDKCTSGLVERLFSDETSGDSLSALQLLESAGKSVRESIPVVARDIANIVLFEGKEDVFLDKLVAPAVTKEMQVVSDITTLFRGNSLCARVISAFMNGSGASLLVHWLRDQVKAILAAEKTGDIWPLVAQYANAIVDKILSSSHMIPGHMRRCCEIVAIASAERFPNSRETAALIGVGSAMFLRFVCPAILSPADFGIVSKGAVVGSFARELLLQITTALQTLVNQVRISEGKPGAVLNAAFIDARRTDVNNFLTHLSSGESAIRGGDEVAATALVERVPYFVYERSVSSLGLSLAAALSNESKGSVIVRTAPDTESLFRRQLLPFRELCKESDIEPDLSSAPIKFEVSTKSKGKSGSFALTISREEKLLTIYDPKQQTAVEVSLNSIVSLSRSLKDNKRLKLTCEMQRQQQQQLLTTSSVFSAAFILSAGGGTTLAPSQNQTFHWEFASPHEREEFIQACWSLGKFPTRTLYSQPLECFVGTWNLGNALPPGFLDSWLLPRRFDVYCIAVQAASYDLPSALGLSSEQHFIAAVSASLGNSRLLRISVSASLCVHLLFLMSCTRARKPCRWDWDRKGWRARRHFGFTTRRFVSSLFSFRLGATVKTTAWRACAAF